MIAVREDIAGWELGSRFRVLNPSVEEDLAGNSRDRLSTQLMERFRLTGDPEVFSLLFDINQTSLSRLIAHRLRHLILPLEPKDILQETFFNIYRYPHRFRCERDSSFRVWASAIITNVIRRHLRKRHELPREVEWVADFSSTDLLDPHSDPLGHAIDEESIDLLEKDFLLFLQIYWEAFQMLSARDRQVLRLVEIRKMNYRDVARLLGSKTQNVKMYVFRARKRIHRWMVKRLGETEPVSC